MPRQDKDNRPHDLDPERHDNFDCQETPEVRRVRDHNALTDMKAIIKGKEIAERSRLRHDHAEMDSERLETKRNWKRERRLNRILAATQQTLLCQGCGKGPITEMNKWSLFSQDGSMIAVCLSCRKLRFEEVVVGVDRHGKPVSKVRKIMSDKEPATPDGIVAEIRPMFRFNRSGLYGLRKGCRLSQNSFAGTCGMSRSKYRRIEEGIVDASLSDVRQIRVALLSYKVDGPEMDWLTNVCSEFTEDGQDLNED